MNKPPERRLVCLCKVLMKLDNSPLCIAYARRLKEGTIFDQAKRVVECRG